MPGESCGGEKDERPQSPPAPSHATPPSSPSPLPSPGLARAAGPGWLPSHQVSLSPAGGQTCGGTRRVRASGAAPCSCRRGSGRGAAGPSLSNQAPPSPRPERVRKGLLGTSPHPQTPEVSPDSRRMELRKVPSSSSGSPVLGKERAEGSGDEKGKRQRLPRIPQDSPHFTDPWTEGQRWASSGLGVRQEPEKRAHPGAV